MESFILRALWAAATCACIVASACSGGTGAASTGADGDAAADGTGLPASDADGTGLPASDAAATSDAKPSGDAAGSTDAAQDADAGPARCNAILQTGPTPVRSVAAAPAHQGGVIVPGKYHLLRETSPIGKFDELRRFTLVISGNIVESRGVKPSSISGVGEISSYSFTTSGITLDLLITCLGPGNGGLGQTRTVNYTATSTTLTTSDPPSGYTAEFELQP